MALCEKSNFPPFSLSHGYVVSEDWVADLDI